MDREGIARHVLGRAYAAHAGGQMLVEFCPLGMEVSEDAETVKAIVHDLLRERFVRFLTTDGTGSLTVTGTILVEREKLVGQLLLVRAEQLRSDLLSYLGDRESAGKTYENTTFHGVVVALGEQADELNSPVGFLLDVGWIVQRGPVLLLTDAGRDELARRRSLVERQIEFERISELEPRQRGRALEAFLHPLIEAEGWRVERNTRTSHEEIDLFIARGAEYYVVEVKWERGRTKARTVRELYGRLSNRASVRGIVVSMAGFALTATKQCRDYASRGTLLFFGPEDVRAIVQAEASFSELLDSKYHQLTTRQIVAWT